MNKNNTKPTELTRILAHYCRRVPDWLENEYRVPTRVPYGICTVSFAPPLPERDYVPERAFRWRDENYGRYIDWYLMRDDERQRYVVLEIGIDDDAMLYHRYYAVPPHLVIGSALQVLEQNGC